MMKNFKILSLVVFSLFILMSCTSLPKYRQASGNGYGYSESKLSENHYRIHFKLKGRDTSAAMDYAMLRAAEISLLNGYDWFVVVSRETMAENNDDSGFSLGASTTFQRRTQCGLVACKTTSEPVTTYGANVRAGDTSSQVESILEVRLGKGVKPSSENSFSALEVKQNLQARIQQ
ncbi:CC0125/CC1285 family lipoprotein [Aliikangiella sp. IMCC44653]